MIWAECHSDDYVAEASFDAAAWFHASTDDEILALARIGWGGGYPADDVARWSEDIYANVEKVFDYLLVKQCGFECSVNKDQAMAWVNANRPHLRAAILGLSGMEQLAEADDATD